MKSLKKGSILLALCMVCVFVFAACAPKGGGTPPEPDTTKAETPTEDATTQEATTQEVTTQAPAGTSLKGSVDGTTYTNEFLNIKFEVTDDWTFESDAELAADSNVSENDYVTNFDSLTSTHQVYDMFSRRFDGTNISIIIQANPGLTKFTLPMAVEMAAPDVEEALKGQGATDITWKTSSASVPYKDTECLEMTSRVNGMDIYQKQAYALLDDDYLVVFTVTCVNTDERDEILGYITPLK